MIFVLLFKMFLSVTVLSLKNDFESRLSSISALYPYYVHNPLFKPVVKSCADMIM